MATKTAMQESAELVQTPKAAPAASALRLIYAPITRREGLRHGVIGASGMGKTHHLREVVRGAGCLALIHDVKGRVPDFEGVEVATVADVQGDRLAKIAEARAAVFRGDPQRGIECPVEEVAGKGLALARAGQPVLLVVGELDEAVSAGTGRAWASPSARLFFTQGRALGASVAYTTQQPHRLPAEAIDQLSTLSIFACEARSLAYLDERLMLPRDLVAGVAALPPRMFVLHRPGARWDGKFYEHG